MRTSDSINIGFKSMTIIFRVRLSFWFNARVGIKAIVPLHLLKAVEHHILLSDSDLPKRVETQYPCHNSKI